MSSRIRNSESQRGIKGETPPQSDIRERHPRPRKESHSSFRGVTPSRWSDVEAKNATKNDDCSTWPSWDSSPVENNVKRDEGIGDTRHKNLTENAFDGRGRQHHSRPLDDSWSDPQRVRGSARSRSRDKDGSRSRSRSRSRSKGRDRGKGRSRSRSRSWDRGEGGGRGRSRSPFHDDRHESNDNIDRVSGPRLPARVCRDFATGKCRRGSNCRFLHHDNLNSQGGRHSDNDVTHRSSSRPEYEGASRYGDNGDSVDRMHDKVSDGSRRYSGKDEPDRTERSGSRPEHGGASRYGDNRTSAEDRLRNKVSDGTRRYNVEDEPVRDNHNRGNRNASYNHDSKGPPNRSGKVPCKYFLIGKCHREDCRFSHDAPMSEGVDGRSRDDRLGHNADEKKSWNGPTWDEVTPNLANSTKSTGLHDSSFHNLNSHDSTTYEKRADEKNKSWNGPTWDEVNASDLSDIAKSSTHENNAWNDITWDETSVPGRKLDTPVMHAHVSKSSNRYGRDNPATFDDSNVLDVDMVSEDSTYPVVTPKQVFAQSDHSMSYQSPLNLGGNEQRPPTIPLNPLNRPNDNLSGSEGAIYPPLTQPIQTRINRNDVGEAQELPELGGRQVMPEMSGTVVSSEQVAQITDLPAILNQISQNGQLPQMIAALNPNNGMGLAHSIPTSTSVPNSTKLVTGEVPSEEHQKSPKSNQQGPGASEEVKNVAEKIKREQEKNQAGSSDARGIVEEGSNGNDEKAMRLFKNALIDFVKEILKPTWKEGGMSREVHKTVVKKVVDKVTSTVQGIQIPRTPEKIEQYLAFSKSKITKLVAAYVERLSKAADA